jgi:hypothetical protein
MIPDPLSSLRAAALRLSREARAQGGSVNEACRRWSPDDPAVVAYREEVERQEREWWRKEQA